jgi:hypothetical protein
MTRLIPTFILVVLVARDLRLRAKHKKPDRWHWADLELVNRGFYQKDTLYSLVLMRVLELESNSVNTGVGDNI